MSPVDQQRRGQGAKADQEQAENNVQITRDILFETMGLEKDDGRILVGELPVLSKTIVPKVLQFNSNDRAILGPSRLYA